MTAPEELAPCPFCGGDADCNPDERGSGGQHVPPYHAGCVACRVFFTNEEYGEAIASWNRRIDRLSAPKQVTEEMVERATAAHFDHNNLNRWGDWMSPEYQNGFKVKMRAALTAALSPKETT